MSYTSKAILLLIICGAAVFFVGQEERRGTTAKLNRGYVDWLLGSSRGQVHDPSVTLLTIDEQQAPIFQSWPPTPLDYSIMLRRLQLCGPKVAAAEPSLHWGDADETELEVLRRVGLQFETDQLLLGAVLQANTAAVPLAPRTVSLLRPIPEGNIAGDISRLPEFTAVRTLPDRRLTAAGAPVGFTEIDLGDQPEDGDSLVAPLLARVDKTIVPSFVLMAAMLELDASAEDVQVKLGQSITIKDDLVIPIDASGALNVFTGLRSALPIRPATILVLDPSSTGGGAGGELGQSDRGALESRVVVLGMNDKSSRLIPAGKGEFISRAELFALAIATIQSGRYIEKLPSPVRWAVWAAIILLGLWLVRQTRKRAFALGLLALVVYFIANMLLFQSTPRWIPPAIPLALFGCVLLGALTLGKSATSDEAGSTAAES